MFIELFFKYLNNSLWGGVFKFINFNKIWEVVNNCDVIFFVDSE